MRSSHCSRRWRRSGRCFTSASTGNTMGSCDGKRERQDCKPRSMAPPDTVGRLRSNDFRFDRNSLVGLLWMEYSSGSRAKSMRSLTNSTWINVKGGLFLFLGLLSGTMLFFSHPTLKAGLLLVLTVWSFCRFYYFAFYVIEHYVDPNYRFSGLLSFARYLIRKERPEP